MKFKQMSFLDSSAAVAREESPPGLGLESRSNGIRISQEMEIGRAGEYLVLADLLLHGWVAYPTTQGVPYDVAVDVGDRIIRLQVKTTQMPKSPKALQRNKQASPLYVFQTRRAGKLGKRRYRDDEFDILALVALDRRLIAYYPLFESKHDCIAIRVPGLTYGAGGIRARYFESAGSTWL